MSSRHCTCAASFWWGTAWAAAWRCDTYGRHPGGGVKKLVLLAAGAPCWTERPGFPYGLPRQSATELIRLAMADRPQFADLFTRLLFANEHSEAALHWFRDVVLSASSTATIQSGYTYRDEDGREDLAFVHVPAAVFAGRTGRPRSRRPQRFPAPRHPGRLPLYPSLQRPRPDIRRAGGVQPQLSGIPKTVGQTW